MTSRKRFMHMSFDAMKVQELGFNEPSSLPMNPKHITRSDRTSKQRPTDSATWPLRENTGTNNDLILAKSSDGRVEMKSNTLPFFI